MIAIVLLMVAFESKGSQLRLQFSNLGDLWVNISAVGKNFLKPFICFSKEVSGH